MKVIVSNIQRFCLHDGPGIRTTVFFKGCNLKCPWCSNPENIDFEVQEYFKDGEKNVYGKEISLENLEKEILKDKDYYEKEGGVTFSGGEPLLQFKNIEPLLKNLKEKDINICVETALTVSTEIIDIAIKYVDEFIIDIKILDENSSYKINGNVEFFYKNIEKLLKNNVNVTFRIPLVPEFTVTEENINKIYDFLKIYKPQKVEIFKIHRLGESKYKSLGKEMMEFKDISDDKILEIKEKIKKLNIEVDYIKI